MRTAHFIYSVPFVPNRVERVRERVAWKARRLVGNNRPPWRDGRVLLHNRVVNTPASITINVLEHLRQSYRVQLYDWLEHGCVEVEEDDLVVGLPAHVPDTIMRNTLDSRPGVGTRVVLMPYSHGIVEMQEWAYPYYALADSVAAITGRYWFDTIDSSIFAPFKDKMVHVDLAVDSAQYPRVKRAFNPPGHRGFLYIGHSQHEFPYKGVHLLSELARLLPEMRFGWIGQGPEIAHVEHVSPARELTPAFMSEVCRDFDFLLTMGISDANPTTILEAMSWGLPVICTPQSGYYNMPSIINVTIDDMEANRAILQRWQSVDDHELERVADTNRQLIETTFTWDNFNQHLDSAIALADQRRMERHPSQ